MSAWASDDLASVIIRPDVEFAGWGQGVIEFWDPDTFENVIQYRGSQHENLPVASGLEALTYQPGDVVMLSRWQPTGGGATTLRIGAGGRVIVPGTGAAEQAIAFMRTSLVRALSAEIFSDRLLISVTNAPAVFNAGTLGFVSHPGGSDDAAIVSNVEIGETGRAWVIISTSLAWTSSGDGNVNGFVSTKITGATSVDPFGQLRGAAGSGTTAPNGNFAGCNSHVFEGLNPGIHTFEAQYDVTILASTGSVSFGTTTLIVVPF